MKQRPSRLVNHPPQTFLKQKALWPGFINYWFPLIRPAVTTYFWVGYIGGGRLQGHKTTKFSPKKQPAPRWTYHLYRSTFETRSGSRCPTYSWEKARYHVSPGGWWWLLLVEAEFCRSCGANGLLYLELWAKFMWNPLFSRKNDIFWTWMSLSWWFLVLLSR